MEQENKEFPQHLEQTSTEMAAPEVAPSLETEGVIVEQPLTVEEKQELTEQLSEQTDVAPTVGEVKAVIQERIAQQEEIDKTDEHLKSDSSKFKDSSDAYKVVNDLMNGGS